MKLRIDITLGADNIRTRHELLTLLELALPAQINKKIVVDHYTQSIVADHRSRGGIHDENGKHVGTFQIIEE